MNVSVWDMAFNILLLLFWFRIWTDRDEDTHLNPHYAPIWRVSEAAIDFLGAVFRGLPARLVAAMALVFLIVFRGVAMYGLATRDSTIIWPLRLGFNRAVLYPEGAGASEYLLFSALSFGLFLFSFWSLCLLYARTSRTSSSRPSADTLRHLGSPFALLPLEWRPPVLMLLGMALSLVLVFDYHTGVAEFLQQNLTGNSILKMALSTLMAWVQLLSLIQVMMIVLIIGSWASMFSISQELMYFCRDWTELLLGPLRRFPLRIGILDLTPLIFLFTLGFLQQNILRPMIERAYLGLP